MGKRGPKSSAALAVVAGGTIERLERPAPPEELSAEEANEWRAIVDRLPADWFPRETHALLANYCRHLCLGRKVWQLLGSETGKKKKPDLERIEQLQRMAERETRVTASLATKMRISQQTQYDKKKVRGGAGGGPKPWEDD